MLKQSSAAAPSFLEGAFSFFPELPARGRFRRGLDGSGNIIAKTVGTFSAYRFTPWTMLVPKLSLSAVMDTNSNAAAS